MRMNWRFRKGKVKRLARRLVPHISYAMGCRGHPGLVVNRNYDHRWNHQDLMGADVEIKSLVDGVTENCSIYHCAPLAISKVEAERRAEEIRTINSFDLSIMYGHSIADVKEWWDDWIARGVLWYVLHEQNGYTVRSNQAYTKDEAEEEVERLRQDWLVEQGIANPRMVDMRTYPVGPKLLNVGTT